MAAEVSAAVSSAVDEEPEPVPSLGIMEICSAVNGEVAVAVASAAGVGEDAAAVAACNADAAEPVASEPSLSARLMSAVLGTGVCAALAASSAGAAEEAEGAAVCAGRPAAVAPVPEAGGWSFKLDTEVGVARAPPVGLAAADDLAARAAAVAAAEALLDCAVVDAADAAAEVAAEPSVAVSGSAAEASRSVVAAANAVPCAPATFCGEPAAGAGAVIAGSAPAAALESAVPGVMAPVAPAVVAPATAGAAVSEASPSPSSRLGEAAGAPLGPRRCAGSAGTAGAAAGVAAAGGATLPEGGNASPLRLPAPGLVESSFRLCLAEARSSAPAKSRALEALAVVSADVAAFCELSCGGACWGTATTGVRIARMAAFMVHEVASDVPSGGATLQTDDGRPRAQHRRLGS
jgi:hypothetical protein